MSIWKQGVDATFFVVRQQLALPFGWDHPKNTFKGLELIFSMRSA